MWSRTRNKVRDLESEIERLNTIIEYIVRRCIKPIEEKEAEEAAALKRQREKAKHEAKQHKIDVLNHHYNKCPRCNGEDCMYSLLEQQYVSRIPQMDDTGNLEWWYISSPTAKYKGRLNLDSYREEEFKRLIHFRCQCGHEWVELPKDYNEAEK